MTATDKDAAMRADFEAWARSENFDLDARPGAGYESLITAAAWEGAQWATRRASARGWTEEQKHRAVLAIEAKVDEQLIASAIRPCDMFRQDGADILAAALLAAAAPEQKPEAQ